MAILYYDDCLLVTMASKKGKGGVGDKRKKFTPQNPLRLTDSELREFLALSDEEEDLGGIAKSDISEEEDIRDEKERWLFRESTTPPPGPSPVPPLSPGSQTPTPSTSTADSLATSVVQPHVCALVYIYDLFI